MRISDIINITKEYLFLGVIAVFFLSASLTIGYLLIYKKLYKGKKKLPVKKLTVAAVLCCYLIVVIGATFGSRGGWYQGSISIHPFSSYREAWNNFSPTAWRNIILNICLFIPLGIILPLLSDFFRKAWRTYLAGFALTVFIELGQYITGFGIFEVDDIIGNTLGAIIGYGIVTALIHIIDTVLKRDLNSKTPVILILQIPLLATLILFTGIFYAYSKQELGNLSIAYDYKYDMSNIEIKSNLNLSNIPEETYVYSAKLGTQVDTLKAANELFNSLGTYVDESQNDIYENTAVYKSADYNYSVWVDYLGLTMWFIDFNQRENQSQEVYTLDEVVSALERYNIDLPEDIQFTSEGEGNYKITANMGQYKDGFIDGTLTCTIVDGGVVSGFRNNLIEYKKYKEYDIISQEQAFNSLRKGKINHRFFYGGVKEIIIENVRLGYELDTKGYYQPVYIFGVKLDGRSAELPIPAI